MTCGCPPDGMVVVHMKEVWERDLLISFSSAISTDLRGYPTEGSQLVEFSQFTCVGFKFFCCQGFDEAAWCEENALSRDSQLLLVAVSIGDEILKRF